ncbi:lymphocyte expansion molecule-like [Megalops cyprinoides]|uniref:lymphocyte expansion molecule-like n=1 Tax=Megalops cyprinoides TaxID=118141 RepID=UPI00186422A8|nr:lymphocyte expansion molecule-like [Megalops cyprinoides]
MTEKKFKGAPFGTQSTRFDVSGVYPTLKKIGTYTEIPYCKTRTSELERNLGPGRYNVDTSDFSTRVLQEQTKGPGWKRAQEVAWLAQLPHILYKDTWEHKRFLKTKVGPGSYKSYDFIELLEKKPQSVRGVCNSREERFKHLYSQVVMYNLWLHWYDVKFSIAADAFQEWTPGPGSYGKGGVPSALLDEKRTQSTGTCPTMDFTPRVERFPWTKVIFLSKGTLQMCVCVYMQDCGLGPGTYNLKSSTDLLLSRCVSKKGPYEMFTGRRDKSISSGHSVAPKRLSLDSWEKTKHFSSFVEDLERPEKRKQGLFSKMQQYPVCPTERIYHSTLAQCPRPATSPGPGWYNVSSLSGVVNQDPPPFLSSEPRFSERTEKLKDSNHNQCTVGPGSYNTSDKAQSTTLHSYHSAFNSRTQRYLHSLQRDKYNQERLRPSNIPADTKSYLESPNTPIN